MSKHIPGPWEVKERDDKRIHCFFIEHDGEEIASTSLTYMNTGAVHEEEMEEANAHLMAAAPDMYEALRKLKEAYVAGWNKSNYDKRYEVLTCVAKALAKAEGKDNDTPDT